MAPGDEERGREPSEWNEIQIAPGLRIGSPVMLERTAGGIDSKASTWEGPAISVTVDEGPFAAPLTPYEGRADTRTAEETIDGRTARVVSFPLEDGRNLVAAHVPGSEAGNEPLTVSIVAARELGEEVPLRIARSIRFD